MRKSNRLIVKIMCIVLLCSFLNTLVPYVSLSATNAGQGFADPTEFENGSSAVDTNVMKVSGTIIAIIRIVCAAIATTMIFVIAIKYMTSAAGDRADIKKHAVAYVVGAFILFGAVGILGVLDNVGKAIK